MKCEERATQKNNQQMENKRFLGEAGQQDKRNQGAWTIGEQKKYILFIQKYKYELQNKQKRKDNKIFKNMSNFIQSRDGIQCRSHHMKLLRTHAKIKRIVEHFRRKFRDEFDGNLVFNTSNPNKQILSPSSDNPLNKFSDFPIVKHEQIIKNQDKCGQEIPVFINPLVWDSFTPTWKFHNNIFQPYWNLWPTYGFCSLEAPPS